MAIETIGLVAVTESASRKVAIKANGKVKAQAGTKYLLQVDGTDVAPGNLTVKRVGDDLQVSFEGSEEPDLTIQDFFAEGMDSQLYGVSEDGLLHAYVRTDGQGFYGKLLMMDGESAAIALGGEGAPYSAATIDDAAGFALWPLLLGLAGAGAATAAIIHHNRDDGKTKSKTSEAPTNLKATDDVGSIQGQLSNGDLTDDARPAVSGNGIPGATIHVLDNGVEIGSTTVQPDGTWTFTPELTDGVHTIEVIQAVAGAKPSEPIKVIDLIVDIVAPAVDASLNPESDSSTKGDGITNIKTPSFDGKAEPGATVEVTFATGEVVTVTADAKGEWSVTPTQPLPEGKNDITVIAVDSAGNRSASEVLTILIDSTASSAPRIDKVTDNDDPTKLIDVPKDGSTNDTTPVISGSGAEKGDIIHVFDGKDELGSTIVKDDGTWALEVPADKALTEGKHELTVTSEDPAGNLSEQSQPFPLVIDLTAPDATTAQLAIDTVAGDDIVNQAESQVQQTISGKATGEFKAGDVVSFQLNGTTYSAAVAADGKWSVQVAGTDLVKGSDIKPTLVAHDAAGNAGSIVAEHAYSVDTTAPVATLSIDTIAVDDIVNAAEALTNHTVSGKATGEFKAGDVVSFKLNSTTYSAAVAADGKWSVQVAGSDLVKGSNIKATLVAHDAAGNAGSIVAEHAYSVDIDAPVVTLSIDTVAGDDIVNAAESVTNQTVSGKASGEFKAGDVVSFELNGTTYSATVAADGKWSVQVAGADLAAESNIHATLTAHDEAGNATDVEADRPYTVITQPLFPSLNINVLGSDDIVNAVESQANQSITGSTTGGRAGDIVKIVVNEVTYSGTVDADGKWSISVPGAELAADADHRIDATFVATDIAGNSASASASHNYAVDVTAPVAQLTINAVAGDDIVNLDESKAQQTISGKATGEFMAGDLVSFTLNGTQYSAAVDTSGNWSVQVAGADLAKAGTIHATLEAHDVAGNVAAVVADRGYTVDVTAPVAQLTINNVTTDNILNFAESQTPQTISGKVTGEFQAGDVVKFDLNGTAYQAVVNTAGEWSVQVAGADLAKANSINATLVAHDAAGNSTDVTAKHAYEVKIEEPIAGLIIDVIAGDDIVNIDESKAEQTISGKATGDFKAGDKVTFTLNGTAYSADVAADGTWSVKVAGADLAKGSSINATLVAHDGAGNATEVLSNRPYSVDLAAPVATLTINAVAGDDIVNAAEAAIQQTISGKAGGEFKAGDLVSLELNGTTYSAAVDAAGNWSVEVAGSDLAKATGIHAALVAHDAAGNASSIEADRSFTVDVTAPVATLSVNVIAGDDIVNAAEAATNQTVSGKAGGEFKAGDLVTFSLNGTAYSAQVAADGSWSVQVSGTDLAKGSSIDATLVAHDAAGNQSSVTANRPYTVDVAAPDAASTQLTIDTVAGDDIVNLAESQVQQTISGKAIGEFQVGDVVSFKLNGTTYSATVAADGKWSVQVSGADLAKATSIDATLVAHDAAGNTGLITANHGYTVDVTAPAKPTIDTIYDEESKQSVLPGSNSEDNTPVITGSAEAGSTVIIKNGGKVIGSTTADNNGKWEFTPQTPLDEGAHELTVEAVDKVGNTSLPSAPFNFGVVPGGDDQPAMLSGGSAVFNYTVVLDTSGSMNGTGIAAAKHALLSMMSTVLYYGGTATFDLITFATSTKSHGSFTFAKATDADYSRLVDVINSLVATGGTNYVEALSTASQRIDSEMSAGIVENKQVFFLSDGDSLPVPTASQYASWQSLMANPPGGNMPIPVTTIGLGSGIRDSELSKITTSQTIMSPSIDDLAGIMLNNLFVDSSSGNLLSNDAKIIKDGKEVIAQVEHDGAIYRITGGKLEVQNPSAKVTASYDDLTGRLVLDTEMGVLTLYTKANANYVAGDYLYQLRPSTELNANIGDIAHWDYRYTAMDSQGHSQSATLQVSAELGQTISEAIEILSVSGGDSEFGAAGGAGRYITGSVAQAIASGNFLEVSVDKGKTWSQVSATDGKSWAFVDKSSHTADWTIQARISDGKGNSAYLTEQEVTWAAPAKAPTILGIPKADDGLLSATEANTGVEMTVSLANTGAKAGDIVHVQWGIALFDQTLTALDIDSGQVVVNVPKAVTNSGTTSQGVLYDFDVAVSIVSNGVAGESSLAYHVIGGGFSTKAISDSLSSASSTVVDNTYNGEGFTVTTSGASLEKTAQITNQKYAGLTVSDAAMADMLFTLDKPATRIGFTLSGLESGAEIIVYGTNGNEIHRETVSGTSSGYQYKAFSYQAVAGIEVSSFKVISGSDSLTMSSYTETQALHVTDTRELKIDDLSDSYYGTSSYDVVSLKYSAAGFLASTSNKGFHGGDGVDILKLEGGSHVFNLNLATSAGKLTGFEVLDITGFLATGGTTSGANTLTLSVKDVLENGQVDLFQASGKHTVQMMVKGDANDTVNLDDLLGATGPDYGDWALTGQTSVDNQSYNTYHHSGLDAELLIQSAVKVNLI